MKRKQLFTILIAVLLIFSAVLPTFAQQSATNEADTVRDKVKQKVEETRKNPKAFMGIITDKTESNIQIRLDTGEIGQISVTTDTAYVKIDKKSAKINFSEVAIGDYIVAMGYKNLNGIIEAKRILLYTETQASSKRVILYSTVTEIAKSQLNVKDRVGAIYYVKAATDSLISQEVNNVSKKIKFSSIALNDKIVVIGEINNNLIEARRIYVYPSLVPTTSPTPTGKNKLSPTPTLKIKTTSSPSPTVKP
jgi:hypothetical protein